MVLAKASIFLSGDRSSGLWVDSIEAATAFYGEKLGISITRVHDALTLHAANGVDIPILLKSGHVPSRHAVLYFVVDSIAGVLPELISRGVHFSSHDYEVGDGLGLEKEWSPLIVWLADPAGNVLCIMQRH
ncbi:VOC family protein [Micromonospora echinaurantiaca]|nr:VOC family protein [Micromonospora echinaurantiaca]